MDPESIRQLDDLTEGVDLVEVDYWWEHEQRWSVGVYLGLAKDEIGEWIIRRQNRPDVRMIDVTKIRRLRPVEAV